MFVPTTYILSYLILMLVLTIDSTREIVVKLQSLN